MARNPVRSRLPGAAALTATLVTLVVSLAGCGAAESGRPPPTASAGATPGGTGGPTAEPGAQSPQDLFRDALENDRASLDRGVMAYSPLSQLKTGQDVTFTVTVTDTGTGPQTIAVSSYHGMTVARQDIPTGGIVSVQIASCQNLTCHSESPARQAVLLQGDQASWNWTITAGQPGPADLTLVADTYDRNTSVALASVGPVLVTGTVAPTVASQRRQRQHEVATVTNAGLSVLDKAGIAAGAIVSIGTVVGWFLARRKKGGGGDGQSGTPAEAEAGGAPSTG
jgi:hypothetical protein